MKNTRTTSSTSAWVMPATGVRPPFLTFAAVRAMAPVAGMPPKSAEPMLPTPCATSSMLLRWCELIMLSATTQDRSDSMAARMAMVMPFGSWSLSSSTLSWGTWSVGRLLPMVYRSPMVLACIPRPLTMPIPTMSATRDPGILPLTLGQRKRMARHTAPTARACQFAVTMFWATACSLSMVSTVGVPAGNARPAKSLT